MAGAEGGTKATVAALIANSGLAAAKFVAFVFTGSSAMLAEGIHSVADSSNQLLLLFGIWRSRRKATELHPFGYGRERYFWSFVVSIVLFTLGSLFSLYEGFEKLRHPHEISSIAWAIGVLSLGLVLEGFSMRTAVVQANRIRTTGWWAFIRRARTPELPVVLLEDAGALLGLALALVGVVAASVTGDPRFDALGSVAIGALLGVIAIVLAIEMKSLLIGESASTAHLETIRRVFAADADANEVLELRTLHLGPDELLVAAKVRLPSTLNADGVARAIDRVEGELRRHVPEATAVFVEPDLPEPV